MLSSSIPTLSWDGGKDGPRSPPASALGAGSAEEGEEGHPDEEDGDGEADEGQEVKEEAGGMVENDARREIDAAYARAEEEKGTDKEEVAMVMAGRVYVSGKIGH